MIDRYDVAITYVDSVNQQHSTLSVLDWGVFRQRQWTSEKTIHHAAEALQGIEKVLNRMATEDTIHRVATYDGAVYEAKLAQEAADTEARLVSYPSGRGIPSDDQS